MYVFYNEDGTLKEVISDNTILGSENNKIYVYWDKVNERVLDKSKWTIAFRRPDNTNTPYAGISASDYGTYYIEPNKDRDLKFFKYGVPYKMAVFELSDSIINQKGNYMFTVSAINTNNEIEKASITGLYVYDSVYPDEPDEIVSVAEYNTLLKLYGTGIRVYDSMPENLVEGEMFFNKDDNKFYKVVNGEAEEVIVEFSGLVTSVNGQTGDVVLRATNIMVNNSQSVQANLERIDTEIEEIIDNISPKNLLVPVYNRVINIYGTQVANMAVDENHKDSDELGDFYWLWNSTQNRKATEQEAIYYMEIMTGSDYLPAIDEISDYKANIILFLKPDGTITQPIWDNSGGLRLYIRPQISMASESKHYIHNLTLKGLTDNGYGVQLCCKLINTQSEEYIYPLQLIDNIGNIDRVATGFVESSNLLIYKLDGSENDKITLTGVTLLSGEPGTEYLSVSEVTELTDDVVEIK